MKKTALYALLLLQAPLHLLAQYGGGNGNGETQRPATTLQLDGSAVGLYSGGNGRGETDTTISTNQLSGATAGLYGGGNGRGESDSTQNNSQLNGTITNIFGGGSGRGESDSMMYTNQLDGTLVNIYNGGNGRGETDSTINTNQLNGAVPGLYNGGDGRGETISAQNTLQLDGLVASLYLGGNGRGETVEQINTTILPIQLLSFGAALVGKHVKVNWQTASEVNTAYFVVERSVDGTNFLPIGKVAAAGNSSLPLSYELMDANPVEGVNYYRLKPTDVDGKYTYSSIATVVYHVAVVTQMTVFPNPAKYQFTLQLAGAAPIGKWNAKLVNTAGQTVLLRQGLSGNVQVFDISTFAKGTYFLVVDANGTTSVAKVIKE